MDCNYRRCLQCGYVGDMRTQLSHFLPFMLALILLCFYIIPGLIFIVVYWGKFKCPQCGALDKNIPPKTTYEPMYPEEKKCRFCAEMVKKEAVICKHCKMALE